MRGSGARRRAALGVALLCIVVVAPLAIVTRIGRVEADVQARVVAALEQRGYGSLRVRVAVRQVSVEGTVGSAGDLAAVTGIVRSRPGVGNARVRVVVDPAALTLARARAVELPEVEANLWRGRLTIVGAADSEEARDSVLQRAAAALGRESLAAHEFRVRRGSATPVDPVGARRFGSFLASLPSIGATSLSISTNRSTMTIEGVAPDVAVHDAVLAAALLVTAERGRLIDRYLVRPTGP